MSKSSGVWVVDVKDPELTLKVIGLPKGNLHSVSCGNANLNIVTQEGRVFTSKIKDGSVEEWKQPSGLEKSEVWQVESGTSHHVALTTNTKLLSWGYNDRGQLGRGNISTKKGKGKNMHYNASSIPMSLKTKVLKMSCGNAHTLCLSDEGFVYAWGANDCGQLGFGINSSAFYNIPRPVENLKCIQIAQISAGGQHSFALTTTGLVLCWGSNRYGQLGLENNTRNNNCQNPKYPAPCVERAQSVSCGENHTALLTLEGRVYTCGQGSSGQLGHDLSTEDQFVPREIEELKGTPVSRIACGRDYTLAYIGSRNTLHYFGSQRKNVTTLPSVLENPTFLCGNDFYSIYQPSDNNDDGISYSHRLLTLESALDVMREEGEQNDKEVKDRLTRGLSQMACVNGSFILKNSAQECSESNHSVDFEAANEFFREVRKSPYYVIAERALKRLVKNEQENCLSRTDSLRLFLILPCSLYQKGSSVYCEDVVVSLAQIINNLKNAQKAILGKWLKNLSAHQFKRYVWFFKRCIKTYFKDVHLVLDKSLLDRTISNVESCIKVLDMLNEININRCKPISYEKFYIKDLVDVINISGDFLGRLDDVKKNKKSSFRFCKYPFLYNSAAKLSLLRRQCEEKMLKYVALSWFMIPSSETTKLRVRREHPLEDTREHLSQRKEDLHKRLDVVFVDETENSGNGIRQEFFRILGEKLLCKEFGACYYEEASNFQWFRVTAEDESSNLEDIHFLGLICGLALYNGVTLHLQFPPALYKKLLNKPVTSKDRFDLKPTIYKEEYVDKVRDYYLNTSVEKEFESFRDGFYTAMPEEFLRSFQPQELQDVLVGNERYDFEALQKVVTYGNGYHRNHETIQMFWEVFHEMELKDQKAFLIFLTGTHRIPAYGLSRFEMSIHPRDDPDMDPNEMLPHAYTCFNCLLLPRYTKKASLKRMVMFAVNYSPEFGLA